MPIIPQKRAFFAENITVSTEDFSDAQDDELTPNSTSALAAPLTFQHKGARYLPAVHTERETRNHRSHIWEPENGQLMLNSNDSGKRRWLCVPCRKKYRKIVHYDCSGSTSGCIKHLESKHHIVKPPELPEELPAIPHPLRSVLQQQQAAAEALPAGQEFMDSDVISTPASKHSRPRFQLLLLIWICVCHLAFHMVQSDTFLMLYIHLPPPKIAGSTGLVWFNMVWFNTLGNRWTMVQDEGGELY